MGNDILHVVQCLDLLDSIKPDAHNLFLPTGSNAKTSELHIHTSNVMTKSKAAAFIRMCNPRQWKDSLHCRDSMFYESGENKRRCLRSLWMIWMAFILLGENANATSHAATRMSAYGMPPKTFIAWTHEDPSSREFDALKKAADEFNHQQHVYRVELISSLRRDYESWVYLEASTGTLPCLLAFDGPRLAEYAWLQYLQPIDRFVTPALLHDFLPSIIAQGTYQGQLYSLGQFDSGVAIWGNRRYLQAAGVRIPTLQSPWSLAEFEEALAKLTALKEVNYAINFGLYSRNNEFYAYAYAPILQGFGGDVIDRRTYRTAKGVLDGAPSVEAMKHFQKWVQKGWTRAIFERKNDFTEGKAALSWTGHWVYPSYHKALGKDLVLMPLPDFGKGIKTGMGSWAWGISSTCNEPEGAWAFLAHLLSPRAIVRITNANDAMPARYSALAQSPLYGPQGPLRFFVQQLAMGGVPRPTTPVYGTISRAFAEAVGNIVAGADVQSELSQAAAIIDRAIDANRGYPYP